MATWFVKSGTGGTDNGSSWENAAESIAGLVAAQAVNGGDTVIVHPTHSYTNPTTSLSIVLPENSVATPLYLICADGGDPTGASLSGTTVGNLATGATEKCAQNYTSTLNSQNYINTALYVYGMTIQAWATASGGTLIIQGVGGKLVAVNCTFELTGGLASSLITIGAVGYNPQVDLRGCTFKFSHASQYIRLDGGQVNLTQCKIDSAGTSPTSLFKWQSNRVTGVIECAGCNFASCTNVVDQGTYTSAKFLASNCVISTPVTGTNQGHSAIESEFLACAAVDGTNGADILSYYKENYNGVVEDSQTVYLTTGGATGEQDDGTDTPYSLWMKPTANATKATPLYTPWVYTLVGSTGDKTVTMKACDAGTDADELHDSEIWMEIEYMGEPGATGTQRTADTPMSVHEVDDACIVASGTQWRNPIAAGADRTDTDDAWTGITETNSYTFTASVNCAEVGYIRCRIGLAFDRDVYVDPKVNVA